MWRARQQLLEALSGEVHSDAQMPVVDNRTIGTEDDEMGQPEITRRTRITLPTTPQPAVGLASGAWATTHSTPTAAERLPVTRTSALPIHLADRVPEPLGCVSSPLSLPGQALVRQVSATSSPGGTSGRTVRTQDTRHTTDQFTTAGLVRLGASTTTPRTPTTVGLHPEVVMASVPGGLTDPGPRPTESTVFPWLPLGPTNITPGSGTRGSSSLGGTDSGASSTTRLAPTTQVTDQSAPVSVTVTASTGATTRVSPSVTSRVVPQTVSPLMTTALPLFLMTPLPRIPPFSGEGQEVRFVEWHEHFENVANLAGWDDHWHLVHLASSLKDTAASFYHSCSCEVRNNYQFLLTALKRRFTPVQLTAVQSQLFHNRLQGEKESVEQYVQDLRKLFNQAYTKATREGPQAEKMGQTLLANQFVAGLRPYLKRKLVGVDGSLEELVLKARLEEVKGREFTGCVSDASSVKELPPRPRVTLRRTELEVPAGDHPQTTRRPEVPTTLGTRAIRGRCFNCGMEGHMSRTCPYPKKKRRNEAHGRREGTMSALTTSRREVQEKIEDLRRQLQEAEAQIAVEDSSDVLHSVSRVGDNTGGRLGPSVYTEVSVNGVPTRTLLDTGSPATIVSLEFVMSVMVGERKEGQSKEQWKIDTLRRLSRPDVTLKNYGGHPLDIIAQMPLRLSHGDRTMEATVLIQKGAPNQLLLGTDVLGDLGFVLMAETPSGAVDLLSKGLPQSQVNDPVQDFVEPQPTSSAGGPVLETGSGLREVAQCVSEQAGTTTVAPSVAATADNPRPMEVTPMHSKSVGETAETQSRPDAATTENDEMSAKKGNTSSSTGSQSPSRSTDPCGADASCTGVVRLLTATRIPSGHRKMVQVQLLGDIDCDLVVFTPNSMDKGILLADAVLAGPCATMIVTNSGAEVMCLEAGTVLGTATSIEERDVLGGVDPVVGEDVTKETGSCISEEELDPQLTPVGGGSPDPGATCTRQNMSIDNQGLVAKPIASALAGNAANLEVAALSPTDDPQFAREDCTSKP